MWLYTVHLIWWLFCQWWLRRGRGQVRYRRTNLRNWSNVVFPWLLQWIVELGFKVIVYKNGGRLLQFEFVGRRHSFPLLLTAESVIICYMNKIIDASMIINYHFKPELISFFRLLSWLEAVCSIGFSLLRCCCLKCCRSNVGITRFRRFCWTFTMKNDLVTHLLTVFIILIQLFTSLLIKARDLPFFSSVLHLDRIFSKRSHLFHC